MKNEGSNAIQWQYFSKKKFVYTNNDVNYTIKIQQDKNFNLGIKFISNIYNAIDSERKTNFFFNEILDGNESITVKEDVYPYKSYMVEKIFIEKKIKTNQKIVLEGKILALLECNEDIPSFVIFWFLNASTRLGYTESLEFSITGNTSFQWGKFDKDEFDYPFHEQTVWNGIVLQYKDFSFLFGTVKDKMDIKRSFIRFERNHFPSENVIADISFLLTYILGVELVYIGYTKFSDLGYPLERKTYSTFTRNVEEILTRQEIPPVPVRLEDQYQGYDSCQQIDELIKNYLATNEHYDWQQILWYISYARKIDPKIKIQPLSTAFDLISSNYHTKNNTLLPKSVFASILNKIDLIIKGEDITAEERIQLMSKISTCNYISQNKKNRSIFLDLNMEISEDEENALASRNKIVHGSVWNKDILKDIINANLFMTLMSRLVLKLLSMEHYIDYSTQGIKVAKVEQSQSGKYKPKLL